MYPELEAFKAAMCRFAESIQRLFEPVAKLYARLPGFYARRNEWASIARVARMRGDTETSETIVSALKQRPSSKWVFIPLVDVADYAIRAKVSLIYRPALAC